MSRSMSLPRFAAGDVGHLRDPAEGCWLTCLTSSRDRGLMVRTVRGEAYRTLARPPGRDRAINITRPGRHCRPCDRHVRGVAVASDKTCSRNGTSAGTYIRRRDERRGPWPRIVRHPVTLRHAGTTPIIAAEADAVRAFPSPPAARTASFRSAPAAPPAGAFLVCTVRRMSQAVGPCCGRSATAAWRSRR